VRPFESLAAEAPAVIEPNTPKPAPPPAEPPGRHGPESVELLVTEYMLEPDPKEPTLEEVLRTEASHRHQTPVPLGPPTEADREARAAAAPGANASVSAAPPAPTPDEAPPHPLPTPAPAPVPRFVELSLEDAGGEDTMEIPAEMPRVAETKPGQ